MFLGYALISRSYGRCVRRRRPKVNLLPPATPRPPWARAPIPNQPAARLAGIGDSSDVHGRWRRGCLCHFTVKIHPASAHADDRRAHACRSGRGVRPFPPPAQFDRESRRHCPSPDLITCRMRRSPDGYQKRAVPAIYSAGVLTSCATSGTRGTTFTSSGCCAVISHATAT